jgi:hypothetical protein
MKEGRKLEFYKDIIQLTTPKERIEPLASQMAEAGSRSAAGFR